MTNFILLVIIYFVYGLAFFTMGLAIALEGRRSNPFPLAQALPYLATFGLLYSVVDWADMLVLIQNQLVVDADVTPWRFLKVVTLALSSVCLIIFGVRLLTTTLQRHLWMRWLPLGLFGIWVGSFILPHVGWIAGEPAESTGTCQQCHWGQSSSYLSLSAEWLTAADVWARYLLYLPGSIIGALAIRSQRSFFDSMNLPRITSDCRRAAGVFVVAGIAGGLIVPPAPYFPASVLNYATFFTWAHLPPQVFSATLAVAATFFIVRILRVFEIERSRQLEIAHKERFEAQLATLEAQQSAREEAERWGRQLEVTVQQRTQELEALFQIGTEVSALLDIDRILSTVVENARQLLRVEVATLSLLDEDAGELVVRATAGTRTEAFRNIRIPIGRAMAGRAVATGKSIAIADYSLDPSITHELDALIEAEGLTCHLVVPLRAGDHIFGALYIADRSNRTLTEADGHLLARLGNQASIAIENARLYEQVQNLAVLEERDRLAREMHDSLAQALGYLSLKASVVTDLLGRGRIEEASAELKHMERAAEDAYADVRESILGLRTIVSAHRGLVPTLTEYLHKFGLQNRIRCELAIGDGTQVCFSPTVEVQVVRIIQEALANVRKHAHASTVVVRFKREEAERVLEIVDNGCGFDPSELAVRSDHFGLQTMQERAESVGGSIEVNSRVGSGTKIVVRIPNSSNGGRK